MRRTRTHRELDEKGSNSLQHPVEALGGFAQGGGSFQPYPPPDTAGVDPSNLVVLNLTVEIHSPVKLGLSKHCWPSDHPWAAPRDWEPPTEYPVVFWASEHGSISVKRPGSSRTDRGGSSLSPFKPEGHHPHKSYYDCVLGPVGQWSRTERRHEAPHWGAWDPKSLSQRSAQPSRLPRRRQRTHERTRKHVDATTTDASCHRRRWALIRHTTKSVRILCSLHRGER